MSKGKKIGGIILVIIGTIFLVIGIAVGGLFGAMNSAMDEAVEQVQQEIEDFEKDAVTTYGEIIDIDDDGMSTIEYYCDEDGYWYETYIMVLNEQYRVGSTVLVCYKPDDPTNVMVPAMYMDAMGMVGDTVPVIGIVVGCVFGGIGLLLLIIGIVMLVNNKKDQKWTDEIKARNAVQGIGNVQYNNYQQPEGAYNGYQQQPGGAYNGYQQPGGVPNGYQQPGGAPNGYQQPGQQDGYASNPYQQSNENM